MFSVTIDTTAINARLPLMTDGIKSALNKNIRRSAIDLQKYIINEKLHAPAGYSATMLHIVSGNLRKSIQFKVEDSATNIQATVYSDKNSAAAAYAALHEFGGRFTRYGRKVGDYTVNIPQRSYMRTSLDENKADIIQSMKDAVKEGLKQ